MNARDREFHKSTSFEEAEEWDILQQIQMKPQERLNAVDELRARVFKDNIHGDVREFRECQRRK